MPLTQAKNLIPGKLYFVKKGLCSFYLENKRLTPKYLATDSAIFFIKHAKSSVDNFIICYFIYKNRTYFIANEKSDLYQSI